MGALTLNSLTADLFENQPHQAAIRQASVDATTARVASGSFDRTVCVSVLSDAKTGLTAVHRVQARGVAGSVAWHPTDPSVVTFTTDEGSLGLVDTRAKRVAARWEVVMGGVDELYAHVVTEPHVVACGFASGRGGLFDMRVGSVVTGWRASPHVSVVGELVQPRFGAANKTVVLGIGGMCVVDVTSTRNPIPVVAHASPLVRSHNAVVGGAPPSPSKPLGAPRPTATFHVPLNAYKTSGAFVPGSDDVFCMTDAAGVVSIFDV